MIKIHLEKVIFRNFMSYGNTVNEFVFKDGLLWLNAENGFGKSTIIEVLTFVLFGISYRGGKLSDLRNSKNKNSELYTELHFTSENSNIIDKYNITRTISPKDKTNFSITKNDEIIGKKTGVTQKEFEDNILGFNVILWKNVIAQNTQETKPFIDMPAAEKRALLESIISVSVDKWKKGNAKFSSKSSIEFDLATSDFSKYSKELVDLDNIIAMMKQERENTLIIKKNELNETEHIYTVACNEINDIKNTLDITEKKYIETQQYVEQLNKIKNKINELNKASSIFEPYYIECDKLNTTSSTYTTIENECNILLDEKTEDNINDINKKILFINNEINDYVGKINELNARININSNARIKVENEASNVKVGIPCKTCGKLSTNDDVEPIKAGLREEWKQYNKFVKEDEKRKETLEINLTEKKKNIDELSLLLSPLQQRLSFINDRIKKKTEISYEIRLIQNNITRYKNIIGNLSPDDVKGELNINQEQEKELLKHTTDVESINSQYWNTKNKYNIELQNSINIKNGIDKLKNEIQKIENNINNDSFTMTVAKRNETEMNIKLASERMESSSDDKLVADYINELCSDNGMKKLIFGMFVPAFNKTVAKNLNRFGLPYTIEFSDSMEFSFRSGPGLSPTYVMLSQGQKRKIGFAISMAFRDFISLVGNFAVNILFLDEVLDISTDNTALREMLELAKDLCKDIGSICAITHRGNVVSDMFDFKQNVLNDGLYSSLSEVDIL